MPTISFVTEAFRGLGEATAKGKRMPELPIIVLPKLYDQLPEEEIWADMRNRAQDVLAALRDLTRPPAAGTLSSGAGEGKTNDRK